MRALLLSLCLLPGCSGDDGPGGPSTGGASSGGASSGGASTGGASSGGTSSGGTSTGGTSTGGTSTGGTSTGGASTGGAGGGSGASLRFFGFGQNDVDRVKIRVDDETTNVSGPPVDVGSDDFTIEFWIRALGSDNTAAAVACSGYDWINGNIVFDRDRFSQGRAFGISIAGGRVAFGVINQANQSTTICATSSVLDDQWHHVAVQRRRSDGRLWIFVNGVSEAEGDGPDGDVSYPDDGVPGNHCGGPCTFSDPFIVLGAEKHDAGSSYPSYRGLFDELRISNVLRYSTNFTPPSAPFVTDGSTVGLYHFDEGAGTDALDTSGASGGPSHAQLSVGGSPAGPIWSSESPF